MPSPTPRLPPASWVTRNVPSEKLVDAVLEPGAPFPRADPDALLVRHVLRRDDRRRLLLLGHRRQVGQGATARQTRDPAATSTAATAPAAVDGARAVLLLGLHAEALRAVVEQGRRRSQRRLHLAVPPCPQRLGVRTCPRGRRDGGAQRRGRRLELRGLALERVGEPAQRGDVGTVEGHGEPLLAGGRLSRSPFVMVRPGARGRSPHRAETRGRAERPAPCTRTPPRSLRSTVWLISSAPTASR